MATVTYQAKRKLFVNAHIVESGKTFSAPDTFILPRQPQNNHADPAKVTHIDLATKVS